MSREPEPNILVVEDTEEHAILIKRTLESGRLNPRLFMVRDGQAALDFIQNQGVYRDKKENPRPDLILLDLKLPKVSGLEVLEKVRNQDSLKDIPIVILTASDEGSDIMTSFEKGAESYLTKSVLFLNKGAEPTALLDTVISLAGA